MSENLDRRVENESAETRQRRWGLLAKIGVEGLKVALAVARWLDVSPEDLWPWT